MVLKGLFPWGEVLLETVQEDFFGWGIPDNEGKDGRERGRLDANCLDHEGDVLHVG